jgi:hypothetical protein
MSLSRLRNLSLLLVVALLLGSALACELGGGASKPTISVTAPTSDAQFEEGEEVNVLSSASDAKGVSRVELYVDGNLYRTDSSPSAEGETSLAMAQTWLAEGQGTHSLSVIAYNVDGEASDPWAVTVRVVEAGGQVSTATPTSTSAPPPAATNTSQPGATATTPPPPATETVPPPPPTNTTEPELPDLYISEIRVEPEEPQQGSPAHIGVRIHNGGDADSGPFMVVWKSTPTTTGCQWDVPNLAPGAAQWQECPYAYPSWSNYTTTGIVDAGGAVDESDEDNNELTLDVVVRAAEAAEPDLHVTEIRIEPASPVMGSPAHIGVKVHNQGEGEAHNFKVVWRSGEPDGELEWTVSSLAPGAYSSWLQAPYTYTGHGHFNTHAIVDSDGDVDEIDEGNNEMTKEIDVIP